LVDPVHRFPIFFFSVPALFGFCVSRVFRGPALVDPFRIFRFPIFFFPDFPLFLPCLVRFAPYAPLVAALRLEAARLTQFCLFYRCPSMKCFYLRF
jgi:hypothetical protein